MCGICGQLASDSRQGADDALLRRLNATLRHRGPDSDGYYVNSGAGLAISRLAIIDLAGGNQPIANEDGSIVVVFNGEIYNFRELRSELQRLGHRFRTQSDTEVIVHGDSFDLVTSVAAFEHFLNVPTVLKETHRVLRPGGLLWALVHLFSSPSGGHNVSTSQVPLRTLPPGIEPWDHLRKQRLPFHGAR